MWKYIKAAFGVRQRVPLLGDIPINAIVIPIFATLGFVHPAFWLIGIGFESALVFGLSSSHRFRRLADIPDVLEKEQEASNKRNELLDKLDPTSYERFLKLESRLANTEKSYAQFGTPDYISEPNLKSLNSLTWVYLKLLFAKAAMTGQEGEQNAQVLQNKITELQQDLTNNQASSSVRKSKEATLDILEKRLKHFAKRKETLAEIDADLVRIEAEVELARDNAKLQAKPEEIALDVDLASRTIQSVWFYGEADSTISTLDEQYISGQTSNPIAN
ncbi:MAG: hypothetical protein ACSHX6_04900 [Akkermansiaceae bacterium]